MSIETAIAEIELSQPGLSHEAMLIELRARTVTVYGLAYGAELSGVLLQFGLLSLIQDQVSAVGEHTALRNMCIALKDRFLPDGQVDMANPSNIMVLNSFLADATVSAVLSAQSIDPNLVHGAIVQLGASVEPEFSGITLKNVIQIREPDLLQTSYSNAVTLTDQRNRNHQLKVTLTQALPEPVNLVYELNIDGAGWDRRSSISGLSNVQAAKSYFARLPGEFIVTNDVQIRIACPFNKPLTLVVEAI